MITSVITVEEYKVFPYRTGQNEYIASFERLMNVLDINIVSIDKTIADTGYAEAFMPVLSGKQTSKRYG